MNVQIAFGIKGGWVCILFIYLLFFNFRPLIPKLNLRIPQFRQNTKPLKKTTSTLSTLGTMQILGITFILSYVLILSAGKGLRIYLPGFAKTYLYDFPCFVAEIAYSYRFFLLARSRNNLQSRRYKKLRGIQFFFLSFSHPPPSLLLLDLFSKPFRCPKLGFSCFVCNSRKVHRLLLVNSRVFVMHMFDPVLSFLHKFLYKMTVRLVFLWPYTSEITT